MDRSTSRSAATVLVVEDEPLLRDYVTDVLAQSGFDVVEAASGEEALALVVRQRGICAVVSDVAMPGRVNGIELARRLRQDLPRVGVVLVSGVQEPDRAYLPVGVPFVSKPVRAATLLRLVRQVADPRARLPQPLPAGILP
jgi:CheY-like chemotaxis protein